MDDDNDNGLPPIVQEEPNVNRQSMMQKAGVKGVKNELRVKSVKKELHVESVKKEPNVASVKKELVVKPLSPSQRNLRMLQKKLH